MKKVVGTLIVAVSAEIIQTAVLALIKLQREDRKSKREADAYHREFKTKTQKAN